ncbi:hypothetical protein NIES2100_63650 [Calothrix sp. NIES-2100]|uniref:hypothetical protein n=1 Tax=Calothrix sp. NIES-2100 TaxID=1954172 RepID=UPI000B618275|nr:hypothetical protein NIES2100_63650 [Calothrix sp. NIES-2100]
MENFQPNHNSPPSESTDTETQGQGDTENRFTASPRHRVTASFSSSQFLTSDQDSATPNTQLLVYLIPVIGFFPSLWTLYRRQGSREQIAASRLSITLAFTWFLGYLLLATGAQTSEFFGLRLLILNSFLTSGYFLVSVWLMLRLIQGKSHRLPGFSRFADRVLGKYLS